LIHFYKRKFAADNYLLKLERFTFIYTELQLAIIDDKDLQLPRALQGTRWDTQGLFEVNHGGYF